MEKPSLYIGTETKKKEGVTYIPFIKTAPRDFESFSIRHQFSDIKEYTHIIFTSKNAVKYFFMAMDHFELSHDLLKTKTILCIGDVTNNALKAFGIDHAQLPKSSTQEGLIDLLSFLDLKNAYIFLPRSSRARATLCCALKRWEVRMQICDLYDTTSELPKTLPDLTSFKEIIFSSPSTVDAFKEAFPEPPKGLNFKPIGPITEKYLKENLQYFI